MNIETLNKFCYSKIDSIARESLTHPFTQFGEFTIATNGAIMVRVPKLMDVPEQPGPDCSYFVRPDNLMNAHKIPDIKLELIPCDDCDGKSIVPTTKTCKECKGAGSTICSNCLVKSTCLTCNGTGKIFIYSTKNEPCPYCDGTGKMINKSLYTEIGGMAFSDYYLNLIKENCPNAKLYIVTDQFRAYFTFDGGDGFLMSMRK